jgi:transaldolase
MLLCFATRDASMRVGERKEIKIFVDSANLERSFPAGITTNPSILSREERGDYRQHIKRIIGLLDKHGDDIPLSVEVDTAKPLEMVAQDPGDTVTMRRPRVAV